jgi:hypothetical protein
LAEWSDYSSEVQRLMLRLLSRLLVAAAVLAGSLAWAAWVFTRTVGDPSRAPRIAAAVLADPTARAEVAADLAGGYHAALAAQGVTASRSTLDDAVSSALADPAVAATVQAAVAASEQAALSGTGSATRVDLTPLSAAVAAHLATASPSLVAGVEAVPSSSLRISVPHVPLVSRLRSAADRDVTVLALLALACAAGALVVGPRPMVLRRCGIWAVLAGGSWVLLPWLTGVAARTFARSQAALLHTALGTATSAITPTASVLVAAGVCGVAASLVIGRLLPSPALP